MTRDFSKSLNGRRQVVKGKSMRIGSDGFLGKSFGVAITGVMLFCFCGSIFMGWMIKSGLDEMAGKESVKGELEQTRNSLMAEKEQLLAKGNLELVAGGIGLYPMSPSQVKHF